MHLESLKAGHSIYFIGLEDGSVPGVAVLAARSGFNVAGSFYKSNTELVEYYERHGVKVYVSPDGDRLVDLKPELVVLGSNQTPENPEIREFDRLGLPPVTVSELLFHLSSDLRRIGFIQGLGGFSVAEVLSKICDNESLGITCILPGTQSCFREGESIVFLGHGIKSSWFDGTPDYVHFRPEIMIFPEIISEDKNDHREIEQAVADMPDDGILIVNADDIGLIRLFYTSNKQMVTYGETPDSDVVLLKSEIVGNKKAYTIENKRTSEGVKYEQVRAPSSIDPKYVLAIWTLLAILDIPIKEAEELIENLEN